MKKTINYLHLYLELTSVLSQFLLDVHLTPYCLLNMLKDRLILLRLVYAFLLDKYYLN